MISKTSLNEKDFELSEEAKEAADRLHVNNVHEVAAALRTVDEKVFTGIHIEANVGFADVCGSYGRLHTLGVAKEYRGRGMAKELHTARLEAMRLLGVTIVVDEIADWNLASIRISLLSGFKPVGRMYVETIRTKRIKKNFIRR